MMDSIVKQRMRLQVLHCLNAVCDTSTSEQNLEQMLEFLFEDLWDFSVPKEQVEVALNYLLVDGDERTAAQQLLPRLFEFYMLWNEIDQSTWACNQSDFPTLRSSAARLCECMLHNASEQADAVRERSEASQ